MILTEQPNLTPPNSQPARSHRAHAISLVLLGALALVLLLIALDVALIATTQAPAPAQAKAVIVRARLNAPVLPTVDLSVAPSIKPGPDGQLHDAFSVTDFHVHVGHPVKLAINNTDNMNHSITSPDAGVSIIVKPGEHTYTLLVTKAGRFSWFCIYPCDPWSMQHDGLHARIHHRGLTDECVRRDARLCSEPCSTSVRDPPDVHGTATGRGSRSNGAFATGTSCASL